MYPLDIGRLVYNTMARQTDALDGPQRLLLAARLTATSVDPVTGIKAITCPACWDPVRQQVTTPSDPICLGTGFVIPNVAGQTALGATGVQRGYLTPQPFEGMLVKGDTTTTEDEPGVNQATTDTLVWPAQGTTLRPKRSDVLIVQYYPQLTTERFLIVDQNAADALGSRVITYRATITQLRLDNIAYQIGLPDPTGETPGTYD